MLTRQSTLYREPPEPGARFVAIRLILTCLLLGTLVLGAQVLGTLALVSPAFAQTGAAKKANVKKADADTDSSAESSDPAALPPGYIPPREVRPEFTTEKELNFNPFKDDRDRAAKMLKFNSLKITGELKEEDKKLVSDIVRWRLAEMTKKENRATVHKIRDDLNRDLRQAGISKKRGMQEALVQSIIQYAPELFDYHIVARMNAAVLLAELNEVEEDYFSGRPAVPARDAAAPLLKLLADAPTQVRAHAPPGHCGSRLQNCPTFGPAVHRP